MTILRGAWVWSYEDPRYIDLYGRSKVDKDPTWILSVVPTRSHGALISTGGQGYKDPTRFLSVVPTRSHGALISTGGQGYKDPTRFLFSGSYVEPRYIDLYGRSS